MPVNSVQPSEEQVQEAEKEGKKLGLLIASLPISDTDKEALLNLLPHFTPEQLMRFSAILESAYLKGKTSGVDHEFQDMVNKIKDEYDKKVSAAEDKALEAIDELQNDVNKSDK